MSSNYEAIPGWFSSPDPEVLNFVLSEQAISGDILEIGCNLGRTSVLLGDHLRDDQGETLCVCDLFQFPAHGLDTADLGRTAFEENYSRCHDRPPQVHVGPSHEANWEADRFRFIHIDGDHSFDGAALDIADSLVSAKDEAVIVIDDFSHPAYPGVAAATWQAVQQRQLFPFAATVQKLYCALSASNAAEWLHLFASKSQWVHMGYPGIHPDEVEGIDNTTVHGNPIKLIPTPPGVEGVLRRTAKRWVPTRVLNRIRPLLR